MLNDYEFMKDVQRYDMKIDVDVAAKEKRDLHSSGCPEFTKDYLKQHQRLNQRSTSPWEYIVDSDVNR